MSQKVLLENKILDVRGVLVDSSGSPSLPETRPSNIGNPALPPSLYGGYRRILKTENDRYFFFVEHGPGYGDFRAKDSYDNKWRRVDIVACSPAREAYDNLFDSYDSCLEVDQFFPVFFNLDSIHSVADSTQYGLSDSELYRNLNTVIDRIANDSASLWSEERSMFFETSGLSPKADSHITYDSNDTNMRYDGATYRELEEYKSYSIRESTGDGGDEFLVVQIDNDHNVYTSYMDSIQGINVVYYNTTDEEWQRRVFDDDSSVEEWAERSFFKDSAAITTLTDSSQENFRNYYSYNSGLTYHLRDAMGIYHFPDFNFFYAVKALRDADIHWQGTFDSLGSPWNTWTNKHRGFDFDWQAHPQALIIGYNFENTQDSYLPLPIGVIGLRDSV